MSWPGLLLLALASIGHLVLTRASMSHSYTLGVRHRGWHMLFFLHAIVGITIPILIFVRLAPDLSNVSTPWKIYVAICLAALVVGTVVTILRRRDRTPGILRSNHTTSRDAVRELGHVPAPTNTLAGRLARIPGNECFRPDFRQLEVAMRQLPPSLDGLSILHLTDLHFHGTPDRSFFEWAADACVAMKPDLIALTGDIADRLPLLDWLPSTLGKLHAPLGRFFVLGNHDIDAGGDAIRDAMLAIGWTYMGARHAIVNRGDDRILIAGTERPWAGDLPKIDDATMRAASFRILLAHAPQEVKWAKRNNFDLALAGHLHGGQIILPLLGPIVGGRLASGLFDFQPTVLHVARGLGELAPLRFGCPPEVTKLVLRTGTGPSR